jgi:hypothetical protein
MERRSCIKMSMGKRYWQRDLALVPERMAGRNRPAVGSVGSIMLAQFFPPSTSAWEIGPTTHSKANAHRHPLGSFSRVTAQTARLTQATITTSGWSRRRGSRGGKQEAFCPGSDIRSRNPSCRRRRSLYGAPDSCVADLVLDGRKPIEGRTDRHARRPGTDQRSGNGDLGHVRADLEQVKFILAVPIIGELDDRKFSVRKLPFFSLTRETPFNLRHFPGPYCLRRRIMPWIRPQPQLSTFSIFSQ